MLTWLRNLLAALFSSPKPGDFGTAGPADDEHHIVTEPEQAKAASTSPAWRDPGTWRDGWYSQAERIDAHPGRVGGAIVPRTVVVHTTDMAPGTFNALVSAWGSYKSSGACAHFIIPRDPKKQVVQMVPITRNGNHAGGAKGHGWYKLADGTTAHPNLWAIGIELDNAGMLYKTGAGKYVMYYDRKIEIPAEDVYTDARGRHWHRATDVQLLRLRWLLVDLAGKLTKPPAGTVVTPNGDYAKNGVPWAAQWPGQMIHGHVQLDPNNKTDPGPQVLEWLKKEIA